MRRAAAEQVLAVGLPVEEALDASQWLEKEGLTLAIAGRSPLEDLAARPCDLLLVDGALPAADLQSLRWAAPELPHVVVLRSGSVEEAVRAMKAGASDCLQRPLSPERLLATLRARLEARRLDRQVDGLRQELAQREALEAIVGSSPALKRCLELARSVADLPFSVLVTGESGTGKESLAKVLHQFSGRRKGPFVAVDCGAIPKDLADDELFGHMKGAFSGAEQDRPGRLEEADGGTLFLDEVGNLPEAVQIKLLRALQTREAWRLGGQAGRSLDVRVLSATNADLLALIKRGAFRLDLYHRLNEFSLRLPPLRERGEDVLELAHHFLRFYARKFGRDPLELDAEAARLMQAYAWPGNIRQLENAMKRAAAMAEGLVRPEDLPPELAEPQPEPAGLARVQEAGAWLAELPEGLMPLWEAEKRVQAEVERKMIWEALLACGWERAEAADRLGLHVKTLARKIRELGLEVLERAPGPPEAEA